MRSKESALRVALAVCLTDRVADDSGQGLCQSVDFGVDFSIHAVDLAVQAIETAVVLLQFLIDPVEPFFSPRLEGQQVLVDVADLAREETERAFQLADAALEIANLGFDVHGHISILTCVSEQATPTPARVPRADPPHKGEGAGRVAAAAKSPASLRHPEVAAEGGPRRATAKASKNLAAHPSRFASLAPQDDGEGRYSAASMRFFLARAFRLRPSGYGGQAGRAIRRLESVSSAFLAVAAPASKTPPCSCA